MKYQTAFTLAVAGAAFVAAHFAGADDRQSKPSAAIETRIASLVRDEMSRESTRSLSVAITVGGETWSSHGFGTKQSDASTPVRAGSLGLQLASVAALRLVGEKKLALGDEIAKFLPELAFEGEHVTLEQVLAQTSGLPSSAAWIEAKLRAGKPATAAEIRTWLATQTLDAKPGTCFAYSNTNALVAGWIVEKVSGEAFEKFVDAKLLRALGLSATKFDCSEPASSELAESTQEIQGELVQDGRDYHPLGTATLCSNAIDLAAFVRSLAKSDVLEDALYHRLISPTGLPRGATTGFGLGFDLVSLEGIQGIAFGGGAGGSRIHVAYYPSFDLAIAITCDNEFATLDLLERRIVRSVLDLPSPEIVDLPIDSAARAIYVGGYYVGCTRLSIEEQGDRLVAVFPDRAPFALLFQGRHEFVSTVDHDLRLVFEVIGDRADSFTLEERGTRSIAKRME